MGPGIECFSFAPHVGTGIGRTVIALLDIDRYPRRVGAYTGNVEIIVPGVVKMVGNPVIPGVVRTPVVMVSVVVVPVVGSPWVPPYRADIPVPC